MDSGRGRLPTSARFLRAAQALVEEARDSGGEVAWLVTRADGDELVVLCAAGQAYTPAEGERVHPTSESDVIPLELPDGSIFGVLCSASPAANLWPR